MNLNFKFISALPPFGLLDFTPKISRFAHKGLQTGAQNAPPLRRASAGVAMHRPGYAVPAQPCREHAPRLRARRAPLNPAENECPHSRPEHPCAATTRPRQRGAASCGQQADSSQADTRTRAEVGRNRRKQAKAPDDEKTGTQSVRLAVPRAKRTLRPGAECREPEKRQARLSPCAPRRLPPHAARPVCPPRRKHRRGTHPPARARQA